VKCDSHLPAVPQEHPKNPLINGSIHGEIFLLILVPDLQIIRCEMRKGERKMNGQTYYQEKRRGLPSLILLTTLSDVEWVVFLFLLYWEAHVGLMKPLVSIEGLIS